MEGESLDFGDSPTPDTGDGSPLNEQGDATREMDAGKFSQP